jgi:hypothetical protein
MWRGKSPPTSNRSHPLPSGGRGQEDLHRRPIVATRCQAVVVARKISTVWRTVATGGRWMWRGKPPPSGERWLREGGGRCQENLHRRPIVATRCQAVVVARKISTVWRTVATGGRWMLRGKSPPTSNRSHPLPSGGRGQEDLHRLANGGYGRAVVVVRKISTVWRTVATGGRWSL